MQEKEFRKLLKKSINGTLSEKERELLEKFNEGLKSENKEPHFQDEAYRSYLKESIWARIMKHNSKTKNSLRKTVASVAAIFIGLIATGYFYMQITTSANVILEDVITLQLEDGSIKIIEEYGTTKILDKKGNVVGKQNKNQLVYDVAVNFSEELAYNTLTVPYGKRFELQLSDGTKAHLNAGSSLKYPVQFLKGMDRQVFVTGEAFLDVAKDSIHPFIVNVDNFNVRVLGTQFNVHAYPEDNVTEIVLVEGSVSLYNEIDGYNLEDSMQLEPGFKASFDRKNKNITKEVVITSIYTSWIDGELVFRDMPFGNILKKLERHYNITIINENSKLSKEKFSANFGKLTIERVFENLRTHHGINSKIEGNTITIK